MHDAHPSFYDSPCPVYLLLVARESPLPHPSSQGPGAPFPASPSSKSLLPLPRASSVSDPGALRLGLQGLGFSTLTASACGQPFSLCPALAHPQYLARASVAPSLVPAAPSHLPAPASPDVYPQPPARSFLVPPTPPPHHDACLHSLALLCPLACGSASSPPFSEASN